MTTANHDPPRVPLNSGEIKLGGKLVSISEVLAGEAVGGVETHTGDRIVRYADIELGIIDKKTSKFSRFGAARRGRASGQGEYA